MVTGSTVTDTKVGGYCHWYNCLLSLKKLKKISQRDQMTGPHRTNDFYCLLYSNYVLMQNQKKTTLALERILLCILENAITAGTEMDIH